MTFIVISGLSGSGKSTALKTLEDADYFATDNLPPELWGALGDLAAARSIDRVAVTTDARTRDFLAALDSSLLRLKQRRRDVRVLFLEADAEVLLKRYNLTRREHPLGDPSLMLDFRRERDLLAPLRAVSDTVIDTTTFSAADLNKRLLDWLNITSSFDLRLFTFGFKHAPPRDVDLVLDMRTLPNPFYSPELREKTGLDADVAAYVFQDGASEAFYQHTLTFLRDVAERARTGGRHSYNVAIGCTGGQHRSVAVAARLERDLTDLGARIIDHRDMPTQGG
ncbi:RNase adapter RapZ [Deinococcus psychrotolerans]|uniref:RNase adapter RapZ n=1 Tax=Deinococcus psychrotolerans TaxID=2489213 RepID=A0A3G8YKN4_9DEIO|nr:RNase adapter RapZ [Deinococcus psychrotolerans]AZI42091.1 RNase adapter RapZ [Deinococcus psychrotolerans]